MLAIEAIPVSTKLAVALIALLCFKKVTRIGKKIAVIPKEHAKKNIARAAHIFVSLEYVVSISVFSLLFISVSVSGTSPIVTFPENVLPLPNT